MYSTHIYIYIYINIYRDSFNVHYSNNFANRGIFTITGATLDF